MVLTAKAALPALLKLSCENWQKPGLDLAAPVYESKAATELLQIAVAEMIPLVINQMVTTKHRQWYVTSKITSWIVFNV